MKQILIALAIVIAPLAKAVAQQDSAMNYRRSSLYSLLVKHTPCPSSPGCPAA